MGGVQDRLIVFNVHILMILLMSVGEISSGDQQTFHVINEHRMYGVQTGAEDE
jgi:hypothetical protein